MFVRNYNDFIGRKPNALSIEISTKCTLSCEYCHRRDQAKVMSLDEFRLLKGRLREIRGLKRISFCGIGEALLSPDFYTIAGLLKDYLLWMVTSGTVLMDFEKMNKFGNLEMLIFSIDATNEQRVKDLCGVTYNYTNLMKNLERFRAYIKDKKAAYIKDLMNATINPGNIDEIGNLMEFARSYGFKRIHYSLPWGSEEFIIENLARLKREFGLAIRKARQYGIHCENPFKSYCCINVDSILAFVDINGDVYPCAYALNRFYKVGNIFSEGFDDMWQRETYRYFRQGKLCGACYMPRMTGINNGTLTMADIKNRTGKIEEHESLTV